MTWFPVVERELRVAARRRMTYRVRFLAALAIFCLLVYHTMDAHPYYGGRSSREGRELLGMLSLWSFVFAILVGVVATSDSVSEEKREGTLGLLFLTDLKGYDVILGKLVAHSLTAFYGLVAVLPILGMSLLIGGVTWVQFAEITLALLSAVVLSLSMGIFVSTHSRNERKAMVMTFLFLAIVTCAPFLVTFWLSESHRILPQRQIWKGLMFSPGYAVGMALDRPNIFPAASYWFCIGISWLGAIALLSRAAKFAPTAWTESGPKPAGPKSRVDQEKHRPSALSRAKLLDDNPFLWLAMRGEASQKRVWVFILSILAMWVLFWIRFGSIIQTSQVVLPTAAILNTGLKIWAVAEASRRFVDDRRNSAMEFLLSTPLDERQIIRGQWRALRRQFFWPMMFVLLWEAIMACGFLTNNRVWMWTNHQPHEGLLQLLSAMIFLPLDFVAISWAGMWLGITSKSRIRAMLLATGLVMVLPWLLSRTVADLLWNRAYVGTTDEMLVAWVVIFAGISLMTNVAVVGWAWTRLSTNFRCMAAGGQLS